MFYFKSFTLASIHDSGKQTLRIPENLKRFFYDYSHSKFLECNYKMAQSVINSSNGSYNQNDSLNIKIKPCIVYLAQKLESMYKNYWLSSGTLLGE